MWQRVGELGQISCRVSPCQEDGVSGLNIVDVAKLNVVTTKEEIRGATAVVKHFGDGRAFKNFFQRYVEDVPLLNQFY